MTVIIKSLADFLKLVVQSFNLSAIFPAFIFMSLVELYIIPILPDDFPFYVPSTENMQSSIGWTIIGVTILAYLLDAANFQIIRLFEGFWFRDITPFSKWESEAKSYVQETQKYIKELTDEINQLIDDINDKVDVVKWFDEFRQSGPIGRPVFYFDISLIFVIRILSIGFGYSIKHSDNIKWQLLTKTIKREDLIEDANNSQALADKLSGHRRTLIREFGDHYPIESDFVRPTRFGNIIAAAEYFPNQLFKMDTVVLWPYLTPTLTENGYSQYVIREKAVMDFMLNLTVVLGTFGVVLGIIEATYGEMSLTLVLKLSIIGLSVIFLYLLAIWGAEGWAGTIRTAFILFREDLRKQLNLRTPENFDDEQALWKDASRFFRGRATNEARAQWGKIIFDPDVYTTRQGKESK